MRLHTTATCPRSRTAAFALEEAGAEYEVEIHPAGYFQDHHGVLGPCLADGESLIFEPHAIIRHVARAAGSRCLMPPRLEDQAEVDRWMDFLLGNVMSPLAFEARRSGLAIEALASGPGERWVHRALKVIDDRLASREFLVADALSAADCAHAGLLRLVGTSLLAGHEHVTRYLGGLAARPTWSAAATRLIVAGS